MKLLVIDDDTGFTSSLYNLFSNSYIVHVANSAAHATARLRASRYNLILLDLHLPDGSGQELFELIRSSAGSTPIIIVSSTADLKTKITMLESGACDYLAKPFYAEELRARVALHTKKPTSGPATNTLVTGNLMLNTRTRTASRNGRPIFLRGREYALLECLMLNIDQTVSKEILLETIWEGDDNRLPNNIHVQINALRRKLEEHGSPRLIQTIHGIGYRIPKLVRK